MEVLFTKNRKVKTDKVVVKSICFDNNKLESHGIGYEVIDLKNNSFYNHKDKWTEWEIEDGYEWFWNRLNPIESGWRGQDVVKVIKVYPYKEFIRQGGKKLISGKKEFHKVHYTNSNPLLKDKKYLPIVW